MSMTRRSFLEKSMFASAGVFISTSPLMALAQGKSVPSGLAMSWSEWGKLDATGMATLLSTKQVTPIEVARQAAKAVELLNPELNCVLEVFEDVVADPTKDGMNQFGLFRGVPMFVKDAGPYMRGRLNESAMAFLKGNHVKEDSPLCRNFRRAGFNLLGRTAIPAGGMHITDSLLEGISRNPWDLKRTPGGSSGGSSGAVAAGIVPICHSGDGGGSTRSPAILCGLYGHKPTRGLLPTYSSYYTSPIVTEGVLTKTVRDTARAYDQMIHREAGDDAFIPIQMPTQSYSTTIQSDPLPQRIALNTGDWTRSGTKIDPEVVERVHEVGKLLESLGHTVVEVDEAEICEQNLLFENITTMLYHYGLDWKALSDATGIPINEETLEPAYRQQVEYRAKNPVTLEMKAKEREAMVTVSKQIGRFFARYDALLMPVDLGPASIAGPKNPISPLAPVNTQEEYKEWISLHVDDSRYNTVANFTGVPAFGFPTGLLAGGLPIGAQLYSAWGNDALLMQMVAQIERAKPEWSGLTPPLHTSKI